MGTTLTMALVLWPVLYVAHVGDTRCYLLRAGQLSRLTTDYTMAQKIAEGSGRDQPRPYPRRRRRFLPKGSLLPLKVVELRVPALRERRDDVLPLARVLLADAALRMKRKISGLASGAADQLLRYEWPGNVRELGCHRR
jgi:hypothetical protein